jgi:WD40 repeat protein
VTKMNSPFKFLEPYEKKDKNIFFGRDKEIDLLYNMAFTTNLILVYGQTGTGKTSLIRCGLANRFQEGDWFDLNIRRGDDIILSLWKEIYKNAETPVGIEASVTDGVNALYRDFLKPVYLIFDQFEELFILGTPGEQKEFFETIAGLLNSANGGGHQRVSCKIIFAMREEYIAWLYDFEKIVPGLFDFRIRVEPMHLSNVESVIQGSANAFDILLDQPDETIKQIIENNKDIKGTIHLPYLQVYLDRLYREAAKFSPPQGNNPGEQNGEIKFSPGLLGKIGKISDVMALFLDEQTQQMQQRLKSEYPDAPDDVVWQVLNQFATAAGTSSPLQKKELYSKLPIQEDIIDFCLTGLEKARILRVSDKDTTYEIAHDALAQRIDDKRSVEEKAFLKIEKLVKDLFAAYEDTTALLTKEELNYIEPYEEKLKSKLDSKEINFIAKSRKKASKRRRVIVFGTAAIIIILLLLATFAAWQWKISEARYIASQAQIKVEDDPSMALRIAEKAWQLDRNKIVTKILHRIYATNNFYKIIAKHNQGIFCAAFSSDGKYILTGSSDHTARLWNWQGKQLMVFKHDDEVLSVAFSPFEKYILTGSSDHTARLWNWQGKQLMVFKHDDEVLSVAFSPDGKYILTGSNDKTARLWDWQGNQIKNFEHKSGVRAVAFSLDGKYVLTGLYDRYAYLWDLHRKRSIRFKGHQSRIDSVAFSPVEEHVLTGSYDGTARLWNRKGEQLMTFNNKSAVRATAFSPDGKYVLTGLYDGTVRLWDLKGHQMTEFKGHKRCVYSVIFSQNGKYILTGSGDNTARIWNWQRNQLKEFKGHSGNVLSVVFSPDGKYVLTGSQDKTACLWNIRGKQLKKFEGHEDSVLSVAFSPDGKCALTGSKDKTARLWDLRGKQLKKFEGNKDSVLSVVFSPDGRYVLTGLGDGTIRLWDLQGNPVKEFRGPKGPISSISISSNGKYIFTGSTDKTTCSWDWQGNQLGKGEFKHKGSVIALAFSPDGEYILTGSTDKTARLWDWQGKPIQVFKHESGVRSVGFSPDGKYMITGSYDKIARLWNWQGNLLQEFKGHIDCINSVAFSPDGKKIITGSDDQTACLWEIMAVEDFLKQGYCERFSNKQLKKYGIQD